MKLKIVLPSRTPRPQLAADTPTPQNRQNDNDGTANRIRGEDDRHARLVQH
jgi:hypothetical protein